MQSNEILAVVDSVSTEKGLDKDVIFSAIETAIASASQRHFHEDADLFVQIDRNTGEYSTHRNWIVFDESDEEFHIETHISPNDSNLEIGDLHTKQQENIPFGRIETQAARQVMLQKVREAEREKVVSQFKSQHNQLVNGTVKRVTRDNIIVDISYDAEAILPRDRLMPGEIYKINDRIRAVLQIQEIEGRGPQLMLNRSCPEMVTELFSIEVPEINEDIIEIRGVARDAGSRSKIAVKTNDGRAEAKVKVDETEFLASLISSLEVSEEIAEQITSTGLASFDDIAYAEDTIFKSFIEDESEIARIKGAAEDAALLEAMGAITEEEDNVESLTDLNLEDEDIQKLSNKGIKNKDDLAELAIDELQEIIEISSDDASKMIMKAREHWFN